MELLFADGGVIERNPSTIGGTWAWCLVNASGQRVRYESGVIPADAETGPVTNNVTELTALVRAINALPDGWNGVIHSDSHVSLLRVFRNAKLNNVPDWLLRELGQVQLKITRITFRYVLLDGHPTKAHLACGYGKRGNPCSEHNVWADAECGRVGRAFKEASA